MDAELSVELCADDPTLSLPWSDPGQRWHYVDLRAHPEQIGEITELLYLPELREFLMTVNSASSNLQSAKCDAWFTDELTEEEDMFGAACKFASYVDVVFHQPAAQCSFPIHEAFGQRLVELLKRAPEMQAAAEIIIRRAHFETEVDVREGFYFTMYVHGYGDDEADARRACGIALQLVGHAALQMSTG